MIRRKADILLPEALNLFLAVICIILLLILAYQLYGIFTSKHELEQARASLDAIVGKIDGLEEGKEDEYIVRAPKGWYIVSYNKDEIDAEKNLEVKLLQDNLGWEFNTPKSCKTNECLCLCKHNENLIKIFEEHPFPSAFNHETAKAYIKYFFYLDIETLIGISLTGFQSCEKKGLCKDVENSYVDNTVSYSIHFGGEGETNLVRWISLYKIPQEIIFTKYIEPDEVSITKK